MIFIDGLAVDQLGLNICFSHPGNQPSIWPVEACGTQQERLFMSFWTPHPCRVAICCRQAVCTLDSMPETLHGSDPHCLGVDRRGCRRMLKTIGY